MRSTSLEVDYEEQVSWGGLWGASILRQTMRSKSLEADYEEQVSRGRLWGASLSRRTMRSKSLEVDYEEQVSRGGLWRASMSRRTMRSKSRQTMRSKSRWTKEELKHILQLIYSTKYMLSTKLFWHLHGEKLRLAICTIIGLLRPWRRSSL